MDIDRENGTRSTTTTRREMQKGGGEVEKWRKINYGKKTNDIAVEKSNVEKKAQMFGETSKQKKSREKDEKEMNEKEKIVEERQVRVRKWRKKFEIENDEIEEKESSEANKPKLSTKLAKVIDLGEGRGWLGTRGSSTRFVTVSTSQDRILKRENKNKNRNLTKTNFKIERGEISNENKRTNISYLVGPFSQGGSFEKPDLSKLTPAPSTRRRLQGCDGARDGGNESLDQMNSH